MVRVLFGAAEVFPHIKTGGLADVAGALPIALNRLGIDVRVAMPAYGELRDLLVEQAPVIAEISVPDYHGTVRIRAGQLADSAVPMYLIDAPGLFDRMGEPYQGPDGLEWPDNPERFATFARVLAAMSTDMAGLDWQPDVLHCNDWHTGLAPALLSLATRRPATVFTVHSMAYQGNYDADSFDRLAVPAQLRGTDALEFHGQLSFIKGGLSLADAITTVSPTYAREITTPEHGFGLDGLLNHRRGDLTGILNGVDYTIWDPHTDTFIDTRYATDTIADKAANKRALQRESALAVDSQQFLFVHVGRLAWQKGTDLMLEALPALMASGGTQCVFLGSGDRDLAVRLRELTLRWPERVAVHLGYDEALAHRMIAGADAFLMPSRFEPCGLTQLYSLRYGTVPIVRATGGLIDTVVDGQTGFVFHEASAPALAVAVRRAQERFTADPKHWRRMMQTGMRQDFSWTRAAQSYAHLYARLTARSSA